MCESLAKYFSPEYVGRFDGDQYFGLGELFKRAR